MKASKFSGTGFSKFPKLILGFSLLQLKVVSYLTGG